MPFSDDEAFLPSLRRGRYAFQICMLGIRAGREQDASGFQRSMFGSVMERRVASEIRCLDGSAVGQQKAYGIDVIIDGGPVKGSAAVRRRSEIE